MDRSQFLALFDQDQRKDIAFSGMRREVTPAVVRHIDTATPGEGIIIYSHLDEANVEDAIREQVNYFESIGQGFEWKVYDHDQPPDLKERLHTFGFAIEEAEALMALDLEHAPEALWQPVRHAVQRITDPVKLGDVQTIERQVWNEDSSWLIHSLGEALSNHPDQMNVYVAYRAGQPASAGWIYFPEHSQFASLWGGATISDFRRQGLFTALLAVRAQEARRRQVRYLTVDASPMSRPILEKYGFERIDWTYPCKWSLKTGERNAAD
jgi:hypothetical protein